MAAWLRQAELGTLMDLLTADEERIDRRTAELRFDIDLLAERLVAAADWLAGEPATRDLGLGLFGAGTGAAATGADPERLRGCHRALGQRGDSGHAVRRRVRR